MQTCKHLQALASQSRPATPLHQRAAGRGVSSPAGAGPHVPPACLSLCQFLPTGARWAAIEELGRVEKPAAALPCRMLQRPIVWLSFGIGALEAGRDLLQRRASRFEGLRKASSAATSTPSPVLGLGLSGEPKSRPARSSRAKTHRGGSGDGGGRRRLCSPPCSPLTAHRAPLVHPCRSGCSPAAGPC